MFQVAFDLDPAWYDQQLKLAQSGRPAGSGRLSKKRERLLIGYVDGVAILAFPFFQVSVASPGNGEGWLSLNPYRLADLLETYSKTVRVEVGPTTIKIGTLQLEHKGVLLSLGASDPALSELAARIEEIAAEQCHRRLMTAGEKQQRIAEHLTWHRAEHAANTAPLMEHIRDHSLIVYRLPEDPVETPSLRAIVDRKHITADKVYLLCHDFRGLNVTVDPRWVTHVGC